MEQNKGDKYYLSKIVADLEFISEHTRGITQEEMEDNEHTRGITQEEMEDNELLIDSVLFRIVQVAENSMRLSLEFKTKYPDIPWMAIRGMRNRIVHDYGCVSMTIVYDTAVNHIPKMIEMLKNISENL